METDVMTVHELCDYLRVHRATIYRLLRTQSIPAFRVSADWRSLAPGSTNGASSSKKTGGIPIGPVAENEYAAERPTFWQQ
jgi:excisionase family DNA binding protein